MIKKENIQARLRDYIKGHAAEALFEVKVSVSPKNEIKVFVDSMKGVDINTCVELSRFIEEGLNRDEEDFELTVSSAGLDEPLRVPAQYKKNEGREVKVVTCGGETLKGVLKESDEEGFLLQPLAKARAAEPAPRAFKYAEIKETKIVISFK